MKSCYNFDENILNFKVKNGLTIDLRFRGNKTILYGDSGTGKSLIVTLLSRIQSDTSWLALYNADNVLLINSNNRAEIYKANRRLIIIDKGERIITDSIVSKINSDRINRYLIMTRKSFGIDVSPNHYATLIRENNTLKLDYKFSVRGWN